MPQKVSIGSYSLLRISDEEGGLGNPSALIGINAFRTTNCWSLSAIHGAEFHGNT